MKVFRFSSGSAGELLRKLRKGRKVSQERLALMAGYSPNTLNCWENDRNTPSILALRDVLQCLGYEVAIVDVGGDDDGSGKSKKDESDGRKRKA